MAFTKFAVELIERYSLVAVGHVVESFPDRGNVLVICLPLGTQPSPLIKSLFRRQVDPVGAGLWVRKR